ncbi:MAG: signal peptide peptidase SppA [Bdellovibrionales bacterium]
MKKVLRKICTFIGAVVLILFVVGLVGRIVAGGPSVPDKVVMTINIDEALTGGRNLGLLNQFLPPEDSTLDIVRAIDRARRDERVTGLVMRFGNAEPGLAQAQEIRNALLRFKETKKFSVAFAPSFGELSPATRSFYLASTADEVWVQPLGLVGLNGIAFEMPFWNGLMEKYGVKAEYTQRKDYKTAMASFTDKGLTPAHREMMTALLDDVSQQLAAGIAENRKLPAETVAGIIGTGPLTAAKALELKLIDKIAYQDELIDYIKAKAGKKARPMPVFDYLNASTNDPPANFVKVDKNKAVAVIDIKGVIHSGESVRLPGRTSAGAVTIIGALETAMKNKSIKVIILRIDSPGGSAVASETIRRAAIKANEKKPVIVSMGTVAASGGYWIATASKHLIAEPATLTGSIGVVAGKMSGAGLLRAYDVNWEQLSVGENATMWSSGTGFTQSQRTKLDEVADEIYDGFKDRVMEARGLDAATAEAVAQGRVWTGRQALERKLVDALGGMDVAFNLAREKMGLAADTPVATLRLPAPPSTRQQLMELMKFYREGAMILPGVIDVLTAQPGMVQADLPAF